MNHSVCSIGYTIGYTEGVSVASRMSGEPTFVHPEILMAQPTAAGLGFRKATIVDFA